MFTQPSGTVRSGTCVSSRGGSPSTYKLLCTSSKPLVSSKPARVIVLGSPRRNDTVDAVALRVALDGVDEPPRDRRHQHRRRPRRAAHLAEEVRRTGRRLEQRDVDVQVPSGRRTPSVSIVCRDRTSATDRATFMARAPVDGLRTGQSTANVAPGVTNERGFTPQREQRPEFDSTSPCAEPYLSRRSEAKPR